MKLKPSEIKIKERIRKDNGEIGDLAESLKEDMQGACITITADHVLIDGFRRLTAWKKAHGDTPIECFVYAGKTDPKEMEAKMLTLTKTATVDEIYAAGQILEAKITPDEVAECSSIEEERTKGRPHGKAQIIAKKLGIGNATYSRTKAVMSPERDKELGKKKAEEIREVARKHSASAAFDELKIARAEKAQKEGGHKPVVRPGVSKAIQKCIERERATATIIEQIVEGLDELDEKDARNFAMYVALHEETTRILNSKMKGAKKCSILNTKK